MSSLFLDLRTLSIVLMLTTTFLSIIMIFIWRIHKTYPGFNLWAMSNMLVAIGFLFLSLRGAIPDLLSIVIANTITYGGFLLAFEGNRKFIGLKSSKIFSLSILVLHALILTYFTFIYHNVIIRIVVTSLFMAVIAACNALAFKNKENKNVSYIYKFAAASYTAFCLLMIARAVLTFEFSNITDFYAPDWVQSMSYMTFIVFAMVWTFNYMILNNERLQKELKQTQIELEKLATTDFLTGVNNDRRFFEIGENEIQRAERFRHPLSLIMFDLDFFKRVNDDYGHAAGDKVLVEIAAVCSKLLRGTDTLGRLGGEEFAILLPHTKIEGAKTVAEYLRVAIEEKEIEFVSENIKITASFGISEFKNTDTEIKSVLDRADAALYEAKRNGRNRVVADSARIVYKQFLIVEN